MTFKERYIRNKKELIEKDILNIKNKELIQKFFEFEEYKLKRKEGLTEVDERSYKTLSHYITRMKNLDKWFKGKAWAELSDEEIKKVIDDLEDGNIVNRKGQRFKDRSLYYQMFQGKLFAMIGKSHVAKGIIEEFSIRGRMFNNEVRFIEEESFRKIVDCVITPEQRCLLWLAFDIGENIGSLLELEKKDIIKQINKDTNEPEYMIILSKDKLKRSRTPRSEFTNYRETVNYLDIVLDNLKPSYKQISNKYIRGRKLSEYYGEDRLFKFGMKYACIFMRRAVEKSNTRCLPAGQVVTWKDLRSSMACDLLKKGWSHDEVNARLGHKPSSRIIDRYINYLALDRQKPKQKVYQSNLRKMELEAEKQKDLNKLITLRYDNLKKDQEQMKEDFNNQLQTTLTELKRIRNNMDNLEEKEIEVKN